MQWKIPQNKWALSTGVLSGVLVVGGAIWVWQSTQNSEYAYRMNQGEDRGAYRGSDRSAGQGPQQKQYNQNEQQELYRGGQGGKNRQMHQSGEGYGNAQGQRGGGYMNSEGCLGEECLLVDNLEYPAGELTKAAQEALVEAIMDEYKAHATYERVIETFGSVRPFSMIIRSEEQHIASLRMLFDKYGVDIPPAISSDSVTLPKTLAESCQVGVDAEIANAQLYQEKLIPTVAEYGDITRVFQSLMRASQDKHLPAFGRCAQ